VVLTTGLSTLSHSRAQDAGRVDSAPPVTPVEPGPPDLADSAPVRLPAPATLEDLPGGPEPSAGPAADPGVPSLLDGVPTQPPRDEAVRPVAQGAPPAAAPVPVAQPIGSTVPIGPASTGVAVEVVAPETMHLNKDATVTLILKNISRSDIQSLVLRDVLPPGVQLVSTTPEGISADGAVSWSIDLLPSGAEREFKLTVKPTVRGSQDHVATVQVTAASRAQTLVVQPELRVELTSNRGTMLKGEQAEFEIVVTNTGDGPARNVLVQAELSEGLTHPDHGRILEADIGDIGPRESRRLKALSVEARAGGEQTCTVTVSSPDIITAGPEAKMAKTLAVTEPMLQLQLTGSELRYTDTDAEYTITVTNPGTAPVQDVRIDATLSGDGRPYRSEGQWDPGRRRLSWVIPQLEPNGAPKTFTFKARMGGLGIFKVDAEATAGAGLRDIKSVSTRVEGNADLDLAVTGDSRVLDVGQSVVFQIRIRNHGTKDASKIQISAQLSNTLEAVRTFGTEEHAKVDSATKTQIAFPEQARLAPEGELILQIKATAKSPGLATCRVFVNHDDLRDFGDARLEEVANAKITGAAR
jgi:uncharacterized repeat protein (TIGR01451 family)